MKRTKPTHDTKIIVGTSAPRTTIAIGDPSPRVIYHRSGIPARGGHPTDRAHRGIEQPLSYGGWLRLADNFHGWVDARSSGDRPASELEWVLRLQDLHDENMRRALASTADVNAAHVADLAALMQGIAHLDREITELRATLAGVPRPLNGRGPAEKHIDQGVIDRRHDRAHERAKAPVAAELTRLVAVRRDAVVKASDLTAQLREEFDVLLQLEARHRSFCQRRLRTYTRRLARARSDHAGLRHELSAPAWTTAPCPWVPEGLDRLIGAEPAPPAEDTGNAGGGESTAA
ncbi:MAG TPA: hypothetical protein PLL54_03765 [Dermatophilaceae bacterium]|jgi:hypothetical protein|nr:hypothetical protein [Dermatophilaceae bacterium]